MSKVTESKERWILGSLTVLLMLPFAFIIGLFFGINIKGEISLSQDNLSSWVSAISTVIIAVLTIVLAKETWALRLIQLSQIDQIRKDSIKPSVSLYLKSSPAGVNFIDVHIINNGFGMAQNVRFNFKNVNEDTQSVYESLLERLHKLVILQRGISSLSAGEHRTSFLFSFLDFFRAHGEKALECVAEVDIEFEDIEGTRYFSRAFFNFTEYKGISELGGDPLHQIASHLKSIKEDIGHLSSGFKKIQADVYTSEDRRLEAEAWAEQRKEFEKQSSGSS